MKERGRKLVRMRKIQRMRQNREDGWRPKSMSNGSMSKWLRQPKWKAVSKLLKTLLGQLWLTGSLGVWPDLTCHM